MKKENLNTIELFSGTGSFSQVALKRGHKIKTYDIADHADEGRSSLQQLDLNII